MQNFTPMRDFRLEVYMSEWEFKAKYHMTASDMESMSVPDLLAMADEKDRERFETLWLGYTETWGAPSLRELIAATYRSMKTDNILCLAGAGEGLYMLARVLLSADDHVITLIPNYQSAETVPLSMCEVTGVPLQWHENNDRQWSLDIEKIAAAIRPNTKLLSLNFPHNPTGMVPNKTELESIVELCRKHNIYILSDEVYRGVELNPEDQIPQIADLYEKGISLNVMSKAFGLPGLRIGWFACRDTELLLKLERYKHYLSICNSGPSEALAIIALKNRETIFKRNHDLLRENVLAANAMFGQFPQLFDWRPPIGGCVAYPKYNGPDGVEAFCKSLIEEAGVLLLPASIYQSEVAETSKDHFRIGVGRKTGFAEGLVAMENHLHEHYS